MDTHIFNPLLMANGHFRDNAMERTTAAFSGSIFSHKFRPSVVVILHREFPFFFSAPSVVRDASRPSELLQHITTVGSFCQRFPKQRLILRAKKVGSSDEAQSERGEWARLGGPTLGAGAGGGRPRTDREREQLSIEPSREGASSWDSTPRLPEDPPVGEGEWTRHAEGRFRRRRLGVRPG